MTTAFGNVASGLVASLLEHPGSTVAETTASCRVDGTALMDSGVLDRVRTVASLAIGEGFGRLRLYGAVSGEIDPIGCSLDDVAGEPMSIILDKTAGDGWRWFLTEAGFEASLDALALDAPVTAWLASNLEGFSSITVAVTPWDGPRSPPTTGAAADTPRKYVRDLIPKAMASDSRSFRSGG